MTEAISNPLFNLSPRPTDETKRLEALRRYKILDTLSETGFDRITALAARLFDVPIAFISFVDEARIWFKSCYGFKQPEIPRDLSIGNFALLCDDIFVIPDLHQDDRFANTSAVVDKLDLRFYASAPLLTEDGFNLGALCVVDMQPRVALTNAQKATLSDLAAMVMDELEFRVAAQKIAQIDAVLLEVTQGVSAVTGQAFFNALVQHLSKALGVNYACISLLVDDTVEAVKTIAFCAEGNLINNVEYQLQGTPCLEVIRQQKLGCYPKALSALFPDDRFLISLNIDSYASIPFFDSEGQLLGLLSVMDNKPMENLQLVESLLTLFAIQIAAELERQQAEEIRQATTQQLQLYADVVRNTQVGIVVWQLEEFNDPGSFRLLIANPAASETTGFNFEAMIGSTMAASFPNLLQTQLVQQYLEVVQTGRSLDLGEVSYGEDNISSGVYSLKAFPLPDHCLGLSFENITVRKQIEIQLKESQHQNQQIAEAMPGIVFVHDIIEQRNVYTNRQITDFLGYTSQQIQDMGTNVIETLIHPDDIQAVFTYFETFHTAPDDIVLKIEYRARHANGEWHWFYTQGVVFNRMGDGLPRQVLGISIDISDRKRSEQALQNSEAWTRLATQVAQLGAWRLHLDTNLVEMDERMRQIWGEPQDAMMLPLPTILARIHPDDRDRVAGAVNAALDPTSSGGYEIEYRIVWNDGTERWILAKGQARFEGEKPFQQTADFFGTALDITERLRVENERKQGEAALIEQEQRYRYIFEAVSVAIWEEDFSEAKAQIDRLKAEGVQDFRQYFAEHPEFVQQMTSSIQIQDINQASLAMFGAQEKAQLLSSLEQIFVPETEAAFISELLAIANEESFFAAETELQTLQGDRLNVWFTITFPPASEPYNHVLVSLLDITQRKQAEIALRASEERLSLALRSAQAGMWQWFEASNQSIWSDENFRLLGYEPGQVSPSYEIWMQAVHPDDRQLVQQAVQRSLDNNSPLYFEYRVCLPDGSIRWLADIGQITYDKQGNQEGMIGLQIDITDRKQVEQELQQQTEDLAQANRVKDEFLAVLSHELRSPLNPILGWTKLLQTGKFDAQKTKQALEIIERNAKQQTQLIDDLLDISKILRGKLTLNEAPVDLALTIEAALETVRLASEAKHIQIVTNFDSSLPPVLGDNGRLQQIVLNLLSNAVKFTPSGGRVEVRLHQVGSQAQIQVKDTGKGITSDFLPYVFESFRQEDGKTTRRFGGLGLGLAIVRQLTELHGGTVHAESKGEGTGATFTICLPLMKSSTVSVNDLSQSPVFLSDANTLQGIRVLVVDDEADMRDLAITILEEAGAIVQTAASATEALTVFDQFQPMLFISDIGMPDMDGYMLIQQVRALPSERGKHTPAIALTAYASGLDQQQAFQAGFQKHIAKPIEPEALVAAIVDLLKSVAIYS